MNFCSTDKMQLLAIFFAHPGEEFYLSQLGEIIGKKPGVFQRSINALEKEGILISHKRGNQRLFSINQNCPIINEIHGIVNKTVGIEGILRDLLQHKSEITIALIYGSYAKNTLTPQSDVDLLLVTTTSDIEDALIQILSSIEQKLQREINYKIYIQKEFRKKRADKNAFLEEILNDKYILLKGSL